MKWFKSILKAIEAYLGLPIKKIQISNFYLSLFHFY
jgi:hypothetical protein